MKKLLVVASLVIVLASACSKDRLRVNGKGDAVTVERTVSDFDVVKLTMGADVVWHFSATPRLEIEAQSNVAAVIVTRQIGNEVIIEVKQNTNIRSSKPIIVHLFSPNAKAIDLTGSGDIRVESDLNSERFNLRIAGSGDVVLQNDISENLDVSITGSGELRMESGENCKKAEFKISGSGDIDALTMPMDEVDIIVSGSGNAKVNVADKLSVHISGSGDVRYRGNPAIESTVSGSGSVRQI